MKSYCPFLIWWFKPQHGPFCRLVEQELVTPLSKSIMYKWKGFMTLPCYQWLSWLIHIIALYIFCISALRHVYGLRMMNMYIGYVPKKIKKNTDVHEDMPIEVIQERLHTDWEQIVSGGKVTLHNCLMFRFIEVNGWRSNGSYKIQTQLYYVSLNLDRTCLVLLLYLSIRFKIPQNLLAFPYTSVALAQATRSSRSTWPSCCHLC